VAEPPRFTATAPSSEVHGTTSTDFLLEQNIGILAGCQESAGEDVDNADNERDSKTLVAAVQVSPYIY